MAKGVGSGSSKKRRNVKKLYLDNQFAEGKKYYGLPYKSNHLKKVLKKNKGVFVCPLRILCTSLLTSR